MDSYDTFVHHELANEVSRVLESPVHVRECQGFLAAHSESLPEPSLLMSDPLPSPPAPASGRRFLAGAIVFPVLGILVYAAQLFAQRLWFPWYLPVLAGVGVACGVAALRRRRTVVRVLALTVAVLLAGGEIFLLNALRLPGYVGPLAGGRTFPAFETRRADGTRFGQSDLVGATSNAIVFFRGRW